MEVTAYTIAQRFVGVSEVPGSDSNPQVLAMLRLDSGWPEGDDVPWCSAFANYVAWLLRLPRSKSLRARSWLRVGMPVDLEDARPGSDIVVLKRGGGEQPGPEVIEAPGHVGFYGGRSSTRGFTNNEVALLGGNQGDSVSVALFPVERVLGVRRLET